MNSTDVGTTLREMWETRPARPRHDRKIAGVAGAVARRYDIDPTLVRVGFAVAAVYGIGIALYIAGWALLPAADADDPLDGAPTATGARSSGTTPNPVLLAVLAIALIASGGIFWGHDGGFVLPTLAVLALLFLLHRSRAHKGIPGGQAPGSVAAGTTGTDGTGTWNPDAPTVRTPAGQEPGSVTTALSTPSTDTSSTVTSAQTTTSTGTTATGTTSRGTADTDGDAPTVVTGSAVDGGPAAATDSASTPAPTSGTDPQTSRDPLGPDPLDRGAPPSWDPLGAAPFAWDLPEPAAPEPPPVPVRRRSRVTPVTLALAVLGGGVAGTVLLLTGAGLAGVPTVLATVLAVLGIGLVIGAFTRGGRGLIPFALVVALLTWGSLAAKTPLSAYGNGVGEIRATPATVAALQPSYDRGAGSIELDLRGLDLTAAPGGDAGPIRIPVNVGLGEISVTLPPNADVTVHAHADLGDVTVLGRDQDGSNIDVSSIDDLGTDGVRSGRPLILDLRTGLGSVEVHRG
ncbi:hypothetical protein GCM10009836_68360 [Pseudonocardia ailaonensis]|uniref:Phage shock protein PspC N-terminal domain-containing protein n=1 Tax=Pseudonocardia ailaonensis TaxID=367279 RepID=A0ABN2NNC5_9PSEU